MYYLLLFAFEKSIAQTLCHSEHSAKMAEKKSGDKNYSATTVKIGRNL